ncbi:hypothetical protein PR202_ga29413 [Eleusine coracana subsp. coracana]|uniref:Uncharacterized protein n=1 Tax=Eleusine coracana subsp. coracana TaxID=191504 RepID=A0AAV5DLJ8_ELECO|nr:hypothetical protein PR202_ga29413 [Eleusine coracana subsp. coracana]
MKYRPPLNGKRNTVRPPPPWTLPFPSVFAAIQGVRCFSALSVQTDLKVSMLLRKNKDRMFYPQKMRSSGFMSWASTRTTARLERDGLWGTASSSAAYG